jgi:hypothetical protein
MILFVTNYFGVEPKIEKNRNFFKKSEKEAKKQKKTVFSESKIWMWIPACAGMTSIKSPYLRRLIGTASI